MKKYFSSVVKALLFNSDGELLVLSRGKTHPHWPLQPDIPGGRIEKGEGPSEALIRELFEEVGIKLSSSELSSLKEISKLKKPLGGWYLFEVRLDADPEIKLSYEHSSFEWVASDFKKALEGDDLFNKFVQNNLSS